MSHLSTRARNYLPPRNAPNTNNTCMAKARIETENATRSKSKKLPAPTIFPPELRAIALPTEWVNSRSAHNG